MLSAFVDGVVVLAAQGDEVVEVGWSAVFPGCEVMWFAVSELHGAVGKRTSGVNRGQGPSLVDRGQSFCFSDVEWNALTVQHDRDDVGVTGEASQGFHG